MATPADSKSRICVGAIAGAYGVHGQARIKAFTDDPFDVAAYGEVETEDGSLRFTLVLEREVKPGVLVATLEGANLSREDVQALGSTRLFVARDALPDSTSSKSRIRRDIL